MIPDFLDLTYLSNGSLIQRTGYRAIVSSKIMESLKDFTPVVVGTLPLDLFTDKSDIDIICQYSEAEDLIDAAFDCLDPLVPNFHIERKELNGTPSLVTNFQHDGFQFEIVAQPIPVREQFAYRHMIIEWEILAANDEGFRSKILDLKKSGIKTEPAFAQLLGLQGDPYLELLHYRA